MALKDHLSVYQEPVPSIAQNVVVEIGNDYLEFKVSRRDVSPALEREIREQLRKDPDFNADNEGQMDLPQIEAIAKRAVQSVHAYRAYPKTTPAADVEGVAWIEARISEQELRELGSPFFWLVVESIWEKLNGPNPTAGPEEPSTSGPATP